MRTRNQEIVETFCGTWTLTEESELLDMLSRECLLRDVSDSIVGNNVLTNVTTRMKERFNNPGFCVWRIKHHVFALSMMFDAFKQFAWETTGVKYDVWNNRVEVDGSYWEHTKKENKLIRYFRTNGFLHYYECDFIFECHKPADIIFTDVGSTSTCPIICDSGDDST